MLKVITVGFSLVFGLLVASDLAHAGVYEQKCAGCHKAKGVADEAVKKLSHEECVKITSEGKKGEKGMMPPMKAAAEEACKDIHSH